MLSINRAVYVEDTSCYKDYVCQVSKLQHMHLTGLINRNLGGLSRGLSLPSYSNETTNLKTIPSFEFAYISCIFYIRLP